ncbi:glycosyltransferase family 4 protein [Roseococcus sp. YIM B11640]|uniref:glycosyltransferase family 4 protein n=1 Tax=Roseococcus sp. YIM B11640 TaxID=3133973 RepID=UPI003C7D9A48
MHVILDLCRLLSAGWRGKAAGIDRVELAYARHFGARATYAGRSRWTSYAAIPPRIALGLAEAIEAENWQRARFFAGLGYSFLGGGGGRAALRHRVERQPSVFINVSHTGMHEAAPVAAVKHMGARFLPMLHDLIPITHPEFASPLQIRRHPLRVANILKLADALLISSLATGDALAAIMPGHLLPPMHLARFGADLAACKPVPPPVAASPGEPYFVILGTIEPRKNHLMLLNVWRELPPGPKLLIVGQRGWESEAAFRLLDRHEGFGGRVQELGRLNDAETAATIRGARALLFPSFVEGYGIPLVEALAMGVPAICAHTAALVELGGGVADFLDPLDGPGWRDAILDYARPDSPRRAAQLARIPDWRAPTWSHHFEVVEAVVGELASGQAATPTLR